MAVPIDISGGAGTSEDPSFARPEGGLAVATGAEYRLGDRGVWVARGRDELAASDGTTFSLSIPASLNSMELLFVAFDGGPAFLIPRNEQTPIAYSIDSDGFLSESARVNLKPLSRRISMVHHANRFYLNVGGGGVGLSALEWDSGSGDLNQLRAGIRAPSRAPGLSVISGGGSFTVDDDINGLSYWYTFYDSTRGWESAASPVTQTIGTLGIVSNAAGISVEVRARPEAYELVGGASVTDLPRSPDKIRIYRSVDGGVFPDGQLIAEIDATSTTYNDTDDDLGTFTSARYEIAEINGLPTSQNAQAPKLAWVASFEGRLVGALEVDTRRLRLGAPGRPESWPETLEIALQSDDRDESVAGLQVGEMFLVFFRNRVAKLRGLPGEGATTFDGGAVQGEVTDERGSFGPATVAKFHFQGQDLAAFVAPDGIWATDGFVLYHLTRFVDWFDRVGVVDLDESSLGVDTENQRLVFAYKTSAGGTGVMYLHYGENKLRITHPDHGAIYALARGTWPPSQRRRLYSLSRKGEFAGLFMESEGVLDDSLYTNADGRVYFKVRTHDVYPGGVGGSAHVRRVHLHHSKPDFTNAATSTAPDVRVNFDPEETQPHGEAPAAQRPARGWSARGSDLIRIGQDVESFNVEVESNAAVQFRLDWIQYEPVADEDSPVGKGA